MKKSFGQNKHIGQTKPCFKMSILVVSNAAQDAQENFFSLTLLFQFTEISKELP